MARAMVEPDRDGSVRLYVKVVPGAKREEIVGPLAMPDGERLKVKVSAPPEDGRANKAVCALIAGALGVSAGAVRVASGMTQREKTLVIAGVSAAEVVRALPAGP